MATQSSIPDHERLSGRFRADGRIVSASPSLLALHRQCGGLADDPVALPNLGALIRRSASLRLPLSGPILVAEGSRNITFWARTLPAGDEVDLELIDRNRHAVALDLVVQDAQRLRDFTRAATDWLWETDAELRLTAVSDSATAVFGRPSSMLIGEPLGKLLRFLRSPDLSDALRLADPAAWFSDLSAEVVTEGMPVRRYRLAAVPIYDPNGRLSRLRGTAVEVQNLAEASEALVSSVSSTVEEVGEGLVVSDVLRDPIDKISAHAETMRTQSLGPLKTVYAGYAGDIATAARHLRTLIDDVFDVAAIDSGTVALSMASVDLAKLAEDARTLAAQRGESHGAGLFWREPPVPVEVRADSGRTLQILINLMQNAVKFAGSHGPVRISLELLPRAAQVHVDDKGQGIAPEDRERVFAKFERLPGSTAEGTGLGLYISRALARAMGGDIVIGVSPEGGARFTLVLARA